jgi:hypothetical protein
LEAGVGVAQVIDHDDDDVGRLAFGGEERAGAGGGEQGKSEGKFGVSDHGEQGLDRRGSGRGSQRVY